ncbi:uncharacterized protein LOC134438605 [Engraulis encrasicolus]|uniref:uncharacterized protein LOC134438605 n=1 Tax=Engraulis encrasicolus TaxID=184585 RepID=UPI002FD3CD80
MSSICLPRGTTEMMTATPRPSLETDTQAPLEQTPTDARSRFRGKSHFIPPKHRNPSLDTYCRLVEQEVTTAMRKKREYKVWNNLTLKQRQELSTLQKDGELIIQNADKGGAVILLKRESYEREIQTQLKNTKFYRKLDSNPTLKFKNLVHEKLNQLMEMGHITKNEYAYMKVDYPITPVFYTLPKIHKQFIDTPPGRPIVAAIGSLTEKISAFVDHTLQSLVISLPSYVKDSMDFIKMIQSVQLKDSPQLLVTMDIESLYTNVPFDGGLQAIKSFLEKRPSNTPTTECLLDLTECVLSYNYFLFGSDFHLQISGVAMGSKMSPSFASLYVGLFESDVIFNTQRNPFVQNISYWKRYLDDIFFIWDGDENQLQEFHTYMGENNQHLKFTMSVDKTKMNFLDILVMREGNELKTNLYRKSTDRNSLLHAESYHPTSLKKNLPISQFSRIRRICSSQDDYQSQATILKHRFKARGYQDQWIEEAADRFNNMSQEQCLTRRTKNNETESRISCCVQYSPIAREIEQSVKRHWHIIDSDPNLKKVFPKPPRVVYKRQPNLRNMLVRADLPPPPPPTHFLSNIQAGNYKCGNCQQCNFTSKTHSFNHPHTGKKFYIKGVISCLTKNVIYMLKCPCGLAYVGKTTRALKTRIAEHRCAIRNMDIKSSVAVHFKEARHNVSALKYMGIELVKMPRRGGNIDNLLLKRELYWIYTLDTMAPRGMNEDFSIKPFL